MKPFHLSFVVPNLEEAKIFYVNLLDCQIGRDTGQWIDVLFFGHQITIHQEQDGLMAKAIDHFGPVLSKEDWLKISDIFSSCNYAFEMEPIIRDEGFETEAGKFLVKDPAGNLLEFKFYASFSGTVKNSNEVKPSKILQ